MFVPQQEFVILLVDASVFQLDSDVFANWQEKLENRNTIKRQEHCGRCYGSNIYLILTQLVHKKNMHEHL